MDIGRQKCSTNRKDFPKRHSTDPNSPTWYGKQAEKEGCNESTLSQCFSFLSFFLATYDQDRSAAVYCYCSSVTMQAEQEAWPPSSANTVCPRRPLMTQVQYWAKTAQTDHVTLRPWPWRSWRLWLMRVVVIHPYTKFEVRRPCRSEDTVHDVCQH